MSNPSRGYYTDEQYDVYLDGFDACEDGQDLDENPYVIEEQSDLYEAWKDGWEDCRYS